MDNYFIAEIWVDKKLGKVWIKMTRSGKTERAPKGMGALIDVAVDQIIPEDVSKWHRKFTPSPSGDWVGNAKIKIPKWYLKEKEKEKGKEKPTILAEAFKVAANNK